MTMKKVFIYIAMAGLLVMPSCVHELVPTDRPGWKGTGATLKLDVKVLNSPKTKADETPSTRPGDDDGAYNENKVYTLDYFIFNVDPVANVSTQAVKQGRFTFDGTINPQSVDVSEEFDENNNTCFVYAIANLPDKATSPNNYFEINDDGKLQQVVVSTTQQGEEVVSTTTTTVLVGDYQTLQAVEVYSDFKNSLTSGKQFKPQESFVMAGLSKAITLAGDGSDTADVGLRRIASKISLDINVIKMIEQYTTNNVTQAEVYQGTWFPNVDHIQIYLNYVNPNGLVSGTYENRVYKIGSYFSYERNAYIPEVDTDGSYTTTTLARYQDTNPAGDYYNPDLEGTIVVDSQGNPVFTDGTTYPAFNVTGTPFYSYPTTWKTSDATAPFIKIIIPWVKYNVPDHYRNLTPGSDDYNAVLAGAVNFPTAFQLPDYIIEGQTYHAQANRLTSQAAMTSRYGEEFYYKISVPAFLEGETSECALQANKWYMINLDVAVLGSETDDAIMAIDGSQMGIYVVDWSTPKDMIGGDLDGGRYLSTAKDEYVFNAVSSLTIPVISSHPLTIIAYGGGTGNPTAQYQNYSSSTPTSGNLTRSNTFSTGTYYMLTASGNDKVTVSHTFVTNIDDMQPKDVAPITYKFRIQHNSGDADEDAKYYKDITVKQYPSMYVYSFSSASNTVFVNSKESGTAYNNNSLTLGSVRGGAGGGGVNIVVSVSSLSGLTQTQAYSNWVIGDPRVLLSSSYPTDPYGSGTWAANDLGNDSNNYISDYKYAGLSATNFIAPKFMIASSYGANTGKGTWRTNAERCAAYQENGYPAGRWRLPTEAEIQFVGILEGNNILPSIFQGGSGYWANSGRWFNNGSFSNGSSTADHSVRCVYDLWYWGDDKLTNTTSWGGFQTDYMN